MNSTLSNEELAARIKDGDTSLIPLLWGRCRRTVTLLAVRNRWITEKRACIDWDDLMQCGYFAMLEAIKSYKPEKGYKFVTYMTYEYKSEIYALIGVKKTHNGYIFPPIVDSLNVTVENDSHETELIDMLENDSGERIETDYEIKELQQTVREAVEKLPERERYVIQERYFNEREKTQIANGQYFKDQFEVTRTEDRALRMLRQDRMLRALHAAYFETEPRKRDVFSASPESVALAGEDWDKWFENIMEDIRGIENGL